MSSLFIYNCKENIDEDNLEKLSFVTEISKKISAGNDNVNGKKCDLSDFFPVFYWLIRDFSLKLEDNHKNKLTPKEYMEMCLRPIAIDDDCNENVKASIENKNMVRDTIRKLFKERDCYTICRPRNDGKIDLGWNEMKPEFRKQMDQ